MTRKNRPINQADPARLRVRNRSRQQGRANESFEDKLLKFMKDSDEKLQNLRRHTDKEVGEEQAVIDHKALSKRALSEFRRESAGLR